jgi:hypothetical protein
MSGIKIGSTVYSKKGTRATVMSVDGDSVGIMTNAGIRLVNITSLITNPRDAVIHSPGRIEVDLDRLSLDYRPSVITPSWEPSTSVKPYEGLEAAEAYYQEVRSGIASGDIPVEDLTITRKISTSEKNLVELGIGKPGETVSYWYGEHIRLHAKTGRPLKPIPVETNSGEYWTDYYVTELDRAYWEIIPPDINQNPLSDLQLFTQAA